MYQPCSKDQSQDDRSKTAGIWLPCQGNLLVAQQQYLDEVYN